MYKCCICDITFDEPEEYQECVGEFWGSPAYETFYRCPNCKKDEFEEVKEDEAEEVQDNV